jgi:protocatechuate 3,4-dioxygenase beta subunit
MTAVAGAPQLAVDPPYDVPEYRSTEARAPKHPLVLLPDALLDSAGPVLGDGLVGAGDADLTRQHDGEPIGERIVVSGRIRDSAGRPIAGRLVEVWQCNAAGRYAHPADQHPAPLDPNFTGAGRCLTASDGAYRFVTIKPGAYPWANHTNAWRPAHIHFSVFGRSFSERLVTQMYFPGDPLLEHDPIFNSVRDPSARRRLVSGFDWTTTEEKWALGFRFDIIVGGHLATPVEPAP